MIQAMIWAFVFMSGAGMSPSGLMIIDISVAYRLLSPSSSFNESSLGSQATAPLAPP